MLPVKGDDVQLGKPRKFPSYGWDNEYGTRTVTTPDFHASKYMITNGEFLEFVKAGGYRTEEYWSEDGWGWKKFRNAKEPFFWKTLDFFQLVNQPDAAQSFRCFLAEGSE